MFERIVELIEKYDSIVIFGHLHPDGDCYGSQIGLRETISMAYPSKKVYAVGSGLPDFFERLGAMDIIDDSIIENSLAILVDSNDLERAEDKRIYHAKAWCKIDHHIDTGHFNEGPYVLIEDANSTCEILVTLIEEQHFPMNKRAAEALYLGILTDTGRFQFVKDFPAIFRTVGRLCQQGVEPRALNTILTMTSENSMRIRGYVFTHYKKTEHGVIYCVLTRDVLDKFNLEGPQAANMVNLISNIKKYPIWAFFCENPNGTLGIEVRSNSATVQPVCASHGGGGHAHAAGVTLPHFSEENINMILRELDEVNIEYFKENELCGKKK